MDVRDLKNSVCLREGDAIALTGWLVDQYAGLYLLGDHFPENHDFEHKVKISNSNIMHQILSSVPALGGGKSLLFYRARVAGVLRRDREILVRSLAIESVRESNDFREIDVSDEAVHEWVRQFGDYRFGKSGSAMGDWLNDVD